MAIPFLPGYSFPDRKRHYGFPRTLEYSKGVPLAKPVESSSPAVAVELLHDQNHILDDSTLIELTYGPKKPQPVQTPLSQFLAFDKQVLRFNGFMEEEILDWPREKLRIRPMKVLYYLQDDTIEIVEPRIPNSGLPQGLFVKRQKIPHPNGKRSYQWKDLNMGKNFDIYGKIIRLTDCDPWTSEYLTSAGIVLNESEPIPMDEYTKQRLGIEFGRHTITPQLEDDKSYKFLNYDKKVLKFYGVWEDITDELVPKRRIILHYYLADDTTEVLEVHSKNDGRDPCAILIRKQKIPIDPSKLPKTFPSVYQEIEDQDLECFQPKDFQMGRDMLILGKKIMLYDCDDFTKNYYKSVYGTNMIPFDVELKPDFKSPKVIVPPHNGIGSWEDSLQSCFSLRPQPVKKDFPKALYYQDTMLRFSAYIDTPIALDQGRRFVILYYLCDDSVSIFEKAIPNSGFISGCFFKRSRLNKSSGPPGDKPVYYETKDFYIGATIHASGRDFIIDDADKFVLKFMEENPEIYPEECIQKHREKTVGAEISKEPLQSEKKSIEEKVKETVGDTCGPSPPSLFKTLNLGTDVCSRNIVEQKLYSANLPIPRKLLNKILDICTDKNGKVDVDEVKRIIYPSLGIDSK